MAKTIKQMRLEDSVIDRVQGIANDHHDGNFTAAMESIINQALAMRDIDLSVRKQMYSTGNSWQKDPDVRQLVDALHI